MRRSHIAIAAFAVVCVLAALLAWFFVHRSPAELQNVDRAAQADDDTARGTAGGLQDMSERAVVVDTVDGGAAGTNVADLASLAEDGLELTVVRALSRDPVAGATLRVWNPEREEFDVATEFYKALEANRIDELLATDTQAFTTDHAGRVRIPNVKTALVVVAARGDEWGFDVLESDAQPPLEVELRRDFSIDVRVVDTARRPIGRLSVSIRIRHHEESVSDFVRAETDVDGNARLEHVGWHLPSEGFHFGEPLYVALAEPLVEPVEREFDPRTPPSAVIELIAPDAGSLEVRLFDAQKRPVRGERIVELNCIRRSADDPSEFESIGTAISRTTRDGVAHFGCVPVGSEFEASVYSASAQVPDSAIGFGPTSAERAAVLEVQCRTGTTLVGRLLDAEGAPLRERKIRAATRERGSDYDFDLTPTSTDTEGRFELLASLSENDESLLLWLVDPRRGRGTQGRAALRGSSDLERFDVGDVRLEGLPLLASGRVIDSDGEPVQRASVGVWMLRSHVDGRGRLRTQWEFLWQAQVQTDELGRFELRANQTGEAIALTSRLRGAWNEPMQVALGTRDVELVLESAGSVRGTIEVTGALTLDELRVRLRDQVEAHPDAPPRERKFETGVDRDGRFMLSFVPAGTYDAIVWSGAGGGVVIESVTGLVVRAGETTVDPRFDPLRVQQRGIVLSCVDEKGQRVYGATAVLRAAEPGAEPDWRGMNNGDLTLMDEQLPANLAIVREGYLVEPVRDLRESREIVLRRAPRVRIEFSTNGPLPQTEYVLEWNTPSASEDDPYRIEWTYCDPGLPFEPQMTHEGRIELRLYLMTENGRDSHWNVVEGVRPEVVQLDARAPMQSIVVQIDAARAAAAYAGEDRPAEVQQGEDDEDGERDP